MVGAEPSFTLYDYLLIMSFSGVMNISEYNTAC